MRSRPEMFVALDCAMSSCVIPNTAEAVRGSFCSFFDTDITSIFIRFSILTSVKSISSLESTPLASPRASAPPGGLRRDSRRLSVALLALLQDSRKVSSSFRDVDSSREFKTTSGHELPHLHVRWSFLPPVRPSPKLCKHTPSVRTLCMTTAEDNFPLRGITPFAALI
jgi:hypothetical protein